MPFALPFQPPVEPMLAKASSEIPDGETWLYEPKWDGFRALVWKAGDQVYIQSRDLKPLGRYFPELEAVLRAGLPDRCVLDGEIVIVHGGRLDFDAMLGRIHPAASRVAMLAADKPSSYIAWDLLAFGDEDLRQRGQLERRERLAAVLADVKPPIHVTPATRDKAVAADWFARFEGAGLDGVMAKPEGLTYQPGKRAMLKIKHQRTADCVVAGFRWYKGGKDKLVGSLLLGLYDAEGTLHHVGVCAGFKQTVRAELAELLKPLRDREHHPWREWAEFQDEDVAQRMPGATSRWNRGKDLSWEPLRIELVCEVSYDHLQGSRFRHGTHFQRWRPDKPTSACRYDQLEETPAFELAQIFGSASTSARSSGE
ncbi:MAG TPA: ATP-dependent DNA ligase [Kofleriaceae bacterium]|jgi:ATP-dependent DNA ligase